MKNLWLINRLKNLLKLVVERKNTYYPGSPGQYHLNWIIREIEYVLEKENKE